MFLQNERFGLPPAQLRELGLARRVLDVRNAPLNAEASASQADTGAVRAGRRPVRRRSGSGYSESSDREVPLRPFRLIRANATLKSPGDGRAVLLDQDRAA